MSNTNHTQHPLEQSPTNSTTTPSNPRFLTLGETMVIVQPRGHGSFANLEVTDSQVSIGGAESNFAIGLARSGVDVTWLGRVGNDSFGHRIRRTLRSEGVTTHAITDSAQTGMLIKERDGFGRTRVDYRRAGSAGSRLSIADLDLIDFAAIDYLHLTGITPSLSETARAATLEAIRRARAARAVISFDVNYRAKLWPRTAATPILRGITENCDILFAGLDEAQLLLMDDHTSPITATKRLQDLGPYEVVIKLGEDGALASLDGEVTQVPAHPVKSVVDTVGAGDAFVAGYLAGRAKGENLLTRLTHASQVGAALCLHPGDWEGFPDLSDGTELAPASDSDPVLR